MSKVQLTYAELAATWGVSSEAARKKVEGLHLPRTHGNDGKTRVLVDLGEVQHRPAKPKAARKPPGDRAEIDALRQHVETLRAEVDRLAVLAGSNRADYERERDRAQQATTDLMALAGRLADAERERSDRLADIERERCDRLADAERDQADRIADTARARAEAERVRVEADTIRAEFDAWKSQPWWRRVLG